MEFPDVVGLTQDEEWCSVVVNGERRKIRFHEYGTIFSIPGLYEELFYGRLECSSPKTLAGLLGQVLREDGAAAAGLRGIDLGAGNGMVGEELKRLGVSSLVGVDILPEAAAATERDRPGVYRDFVVADLTAPTPEVHARLQAIEPNLLTTVAALGFGDIPSLAFVEAWNAIATPGWVVFNIKESFLDAKYDYGFSFLVRRLREEGLLDVRAEQTYRHRLALDGRALRYVGFVGLKRGPVPDAWRASLRDTPHP